MSDDRFLAVRVLRDLDKADETYTARLGYPERITDNEWRCLFLVDGMPSIETEYAYGEDALQALQLAIEGLRVCVDRSGLRVSWMSDEEGDHMLPRYVPYAFGPGFARRLDRLIDAEVEALSRQRAATPTEE